MCPHLHRTFRLALLGATAFWLPDVLFNSLVLVAPDLRDFAVLFAGTVLMPATVFFAWRAERPANAYPAAPLWMLLGVWVVGPFAMMLGSSFQAGSGFRAGSPLEAVGTLLLSTGLFPVFTFMMATYDGSLGALAVGTFVMIGLAAYRCIFPIQQQTNGSCASLR